MFLNIQIPKPAQPFLEGLLQLSLIISHPIHTQAQQVRILLATGNDPLAARPSDLIVRLERQDHVLCGRDSAIAQQFSQNVCVFDCLACPCALVRG